MTDRCALCDAPMLGEHECMVRGLSLWQPWAQWVVEGLKQWETRSWSTLYRGPLVIHASKSKAGLRGYPRDMALLPRGAIIGVVTLGRVLPVEVIRRCVPDRELALGDFSDGRYAWEIRDPYPLGAIRFTGHQGLFWVPRSALPVVYGDARG